MIQKKFTFRIDSSNWEQHLESHHALIRGLEDFLEPFSLPLLADKFMGMIRSRRLEIADSQFNLEELNITLSSSDTFIVETTFRESEKTITEQQTLTISDILNFPIDSTPLITTERLEIRLLLPSDEPKVINFLRDRDVWKMRGERYRPIVNIHSVYKHKKTQIPWHKYHFAIIMIESKKTIGFMSFHQILGTGLIDFLTNFIGEKITQPVMLSYGLSKDNWGQGIMSEAVCSVVPWFVANNQIEELIAFAEINNLGSRRILNKLGLQDYGVIKDSPISEDLKDKYKFLVYRHPKLSLVETPVTGLTPSALSHIKET
ncbi:GNAT family N-acetyltransferase [Crocosphaera sp. Alani8]|uniref:GNAT family N-acetyltransferase n=1 Tax=Crocosphaera sp. Alani8 TaxID=3038952 RepID=UPI00313D37E3